MSSRVESCTSYSPKVITYVCIVETAPDCAELKLLQVDDVLAMWSARPPVADHRLPGSGRDREPPNSIHTRSTSTCLDGRFWADGGLSKAV